MIKFAHLFREIKLKSNLQNYGNSIELRTFEKNIFAILRNIYECTKHFNDSSLRLTVRSKSDHSKKGCWG